jgi:hypothetical protein
MLALLPMLSTFAPGGQVAGFTTASPAVADQIWYQSVGRASATAACEKSTATELAQGWTNWAPSWGQWANDRKGGFVCNRQITWAFDSVPEGELTPAIAPASQSVNATANSAITATTVFTPTNFTGIPTYTYAVLPTLPTGLSLNSVTGVITGTPTATQAATTYTVTATSSDTSSDTQSATATVIITVSAAAALVPTFGAPTATADGFTVQITNYDAAYTWAGTATASGSVAINGAGLVTVTGVASSTPSTLTVTTTRTGYATGSATVTQTSAAVTCATGGGATGTCVLGATGPGGGKVFYVKEANATGSRYMEAAPNTWSGGSADPAIAWCSNTSTLIAGTFGTAIGTGKANTDLMVADKACTSGAANSVRAYTKNGFTDWFLPSRDELNQLYLQRTTVGVFAAESYWSSSQYASNSAFNRSFVDGTQPFAYKATPNRVRPVRAF